MKIKKFPACVLLILFLFSGIGYAAQPEDALSSRPDDSVYFVLRLGNTAKFLQWLLSSDNIKLIMPLILGSQQSNEILGAVEILSAIVQNTPLRSSALVIGVNKSDVKVKAPFFQMAFTVDPSVSSIVRNIAKGTASASDTAKLLLGANNPLTLFAESAIKVDRDKDNTFRVNNNMFMRAANDLVILGTSFNEAASAVNALKDSSKRLFTDKARRFGTDDFALVHVDQDTAKALDEDGIEWPFISKYFDKPLDIEFAFRRLADKFIISTGLNLNEALKKRYKDMMPPLKKVKGGNIDVNNAGGKKTPLAALGSYFDADKVKDSSELKGAWNKAVREAQKRFGITEEDIKGVFSGPFSAAVNDSVTFEGFKIPALYISQTGTQEAVNTLYGKLTKSQHFSKVQEGILQLDSSLSPISCLIANRDGTLWIDFAELSSLGGTLELKPAFANLMERESSAALWLDFIGIRDWLLDDANGVFAAIAPIARIMGYNRHVQAVREVLGAEFSVPSVSLWSESDEIFHTEFALAEIDPQKGLFAQLIKAILELSK